MEIVMSERFADTTNTPTRGITDEATAALLASIQSMPDSKRKKELLKRHQKMQREALAPSSTPSMTSPEPAKTKKSKKVSLRIEYWVDSDLTLPHYYSSSPGCSEVDEWMKCGQSPVIDEISPGL